jgi:AraC family transcriptional regulator of adaptative response/methylated-DNA-[protein]-cysteine methyltransferase
MKAAQPAHQKDGSTPTQHDPRWKSVVARDAAANGTFYYSVSTTGVYCFPSCAARLANPANVRFHETREHAEAAGFRPCKRCKPGADRGAQTRAEAGVLHFTVGASSLGLVLVAHSARGVSAVLLGDDRDELRRDLQRRFPNVTLVDSEGELDMLGARVVAAIDTPARHVDVPLDLSGTPFQRAVWQALREIPLGSTATYSEIADRIGMPKSARAVAQACAANHLAVLVPCHRVVRRDGSLSGYRWGVARKRTLLAQETSP